MKILIIGHSHTGCFAAALKEHQNLPGTASFKVLALNVERFKPNTERVTVSEVLSKTGDKSPLQRRNSRAAERIKAADSYASMTGDSLIRVLTPKMEIRLANQIARHRPDVIYTIPKGNEYARFSMVEYPDPFRVSDLDNPDIPAPENTSLIPASVMRAQMRQLAEESGLLYWRAIREMTDVPVVMLPPPPAIRDESHLRAHPGAFKENVEKFGLTPPQMRRQFYDYYADALRAGVAEAGGQFAELPKEVKQDGFLTPEFIRSDPIHANPAYGSLMLGHLAQFAAAITEQT